MTGRMLFVVTFCSALGCGLMAGLFFTFSVFVMNALGRLPAPQGIAAMQSINVAILNPLFGAVFFGTAAASVFLAVRSLSAWQRPEAVYLLAGSLFYLAGVMVVTFVCNVPRNDALAGVDPASESGARVWAVYLTGWTGWNHVRTVAALSAAGFLTRALC